MSIYGTIRGKPRQGSLYNPQDLSMVVSRDHQTRDGEKTVQEYMDETPVWSDGTAVSSAPMTAMQ